MIRGMADENHGKLESIAAKLDVIRLVRKRLIENPSRCVVIHARSAGMTSKEKSGIARHEHGSAKCISAYLSKATSISMIQAAAISNVGFGSRSLPASCLAAS
jgi:hypothetical protein